MPTFITLLMHPDRRRPSPPPLLVDLRRVALAGMALWLVALVVTGALWASGVVDGEKVVTCAAGLALGALGLGWERRHRRDYRAMAADPEGTDPVPREVEP